MLVNDELSVSEEHQLKIEEMLRNITVSKSKQTERNILVTCNHHKKLTRSEIKLCLKAKMFNIALSDHCSNYIHDKSLHSRFSFHIPFPVKNSSLP